jgi:hypothetical protein
MSEEEKEENLPSEQIINPKSPSIFETFANNEISDLQQ